MTAAAAIAAFAAIMFAMVDDIGMMLEPPFMLMAASICAIVCHARLVIMRMNHVKENRDKWVRICCMYRQGLRDRIARGEFRVASAYAACMDRMDTDIRREAERFRRWREEQKRVRDADDAMPE